MTTGALGKTYEDGAIVARQGDVGDCLYVVQDGEVEIVAEHDGRETVLKVLGTGEMVGEMAVFERVVRSATIRAKGPARLLTIDRKNFLRRVNEDPSIAFRIVESLSGRIRDLNAEVVQLRDRIATTRGAG
jgi:CRP-like cAMP-binding protein